MGEVMTIGLDLAKNVFQVHGVDAAGNTVLRKRLTRSRLLAFFEGLPHCLVGMETCSGSHHWARELAKLGHDVRVMPAKYVKPYVKTNKTDARDAAAICEAVSRPDMRFVPVKSTAQQAVVVIHRTREILGRQRVMLINALRTHCAEFGIVAPQGARHVGELVARLTDPDDTRIPDLAKQALRVLVEQLEACGERLSAIEAQLLAWHQSDADSQRLATIPGVGPITATALAANLGAGTQVKSGRDMAAWLGLVPRQHSSGDKVRLGAISKRGNSYLRRLLIHGARSVLRWQAPENRLGTPWVKKLIKTKHANVVATAMANKNARIAWSVLTRKQVYDPHRQADVDATAALRG
jgi:transposase